MLYVLHVHQAYVLTSGATDLICFTCKFISFNNIHLHGYSGLKKYHAMTANLHVSLCTILVRLITLIIYIKAILEKEVTAVAKLHVSLFIFYVYCLTSIL